MSDSGITRDGGVSESRSSSLRAVPIDPWLPRAAALRPDRVAVEAPDGALTYADCWSGRAARARPCRSTIRRGWTSPSRCTAACWPARPRAGRPAALGARARGALDRGRRALVVHTSGTTAAPRPVGLTLENVQAQALGSAVALGLDPDERWLCPLPLSHVGGLMVLLRSAIYATTAIVGPAERVTDDDVTLASLVPTQLIRLLDAGARPGARLRRILLGGAASTPALLARARDAGWPVSAVLRPHGGVLEVTLAEPDDLETAGHPLPGLAVDDRRRRRDPRRGPDGRGRRRPAHGRPRPPRRARPAGRHRPHGGHDRHRRGERRARRGRGRAAWSTRRSPTPPCSRARTRSGARR